MNLIVSTSATPLGEPNKWLESLQPLLRDESFHPYQTALDLPVERHGHPGLFSDNPPVDHIDRFMDQLEQNGYRLGIISVPLSTTILFDRKGEELSLLNGWIDMAGYTGCGRFRLIVTEQDRIPEDVLPLLKEAIAYASDLEIPVTLRGINDSSIETIRPKTGSQSINIGIEVSLSIGHACKIPDHIPASHINLFSIQYSEHITEWLPQLDALPHPVVINV